MKVDRSEELLIRDGDVLRTKYRGHSPRVGIDDGRLRGKLSRHIEFAESSSSDILS